MANLSQQRRARMLAFLKDLKDTNREDETALKALNEIETVLTAKKYGLVWEEHEEAVDEVLKTQIPVFVEDKDREIVSNPDLPYNFLLEGDNLHSLYLLEKTKKGKINIIYIDPPYNTGNETFLYDDKKVGKDDVYRHSKWLSFMNRRLNIAKRLLEPRGIIYISIGDEEVANLQLLCNEIFGEDNFIASLTRIAKRTSNKGNYFKPTKDYVLVYAKNKSLLNWKFGILQDIDIKDFKYEDEKGRYKKNGASLYQPSLDSRPNQRYYIECPDGSLIIPPGDVFPKEKKDAAYVKPLSNRDKCWRWSWTTYKKNKGNLMFTKASSRCPLVDSNGKPSKWNIYDKVYFDKKEGENLLPEDVVYDFVNSQGTKEINDLGIIFPFAKPIGLIKHLIRLTQLRKDITILDFFAGSGTTAQAVLELNEEDGGSRKVILCTNNENDICTNVTYQRLKKVILGYDYIGEKKTLLYKKKLSLPVIKNAERLLGEIEKIKEVNSDKYNQYKVNIEDSNIVMYGINQYDGKTKGIAANLKYFKTSWTDREPEDYFLSNALCQHIKEMIELQNAIEVDNVKNVLILNKKDFQNTILNKNISKSIEHVWVNQNIVFNANELKMLREKDFKYIPKEFFANELREVGE
jgi:adenine-specific DNA-methyltransferase